MKKRPTLFVIAFLAILGTCSPMSTSFFHEGYVLDSVTKEPVGGAWVTLLWHLKVAFDQTDASGHYAIDLDISPDSGHVAFVDIEKSGYASQTVILLSNSCRDPDTIYMEPVKDTIP
jgi:hypothetical protein